MDLSDLLRPPETGTDSGHVHSGVWVGEVLADVGDLDEGDVSVAGVTHHHRQVVTTVCVR